MMLALAFALSYLGLACICLSMRRHQDQTFGKRLAKTQSLAFIAAGWAAIALAFIPCLIEWDWAVGLCFWLGSLCCAGLLLITLFSWRPRRALAAGAAPFLVVLLLGLPGLNQ